MAINRKNRKRDGRTKDLTLQWLIKGYGNDWEIWRKFAEEWISKQDKAVDLKLRGLVLFLDIYLVGYANWAKDPKFFFSAQEDKWKASTKEFREKVLENTNRSEGNKLTTLINYVIDFLDFILENYFSEKNDYGRYISLFENPLKKQRYQQRIVETVHNPLPYRYICDLRHSLCPNPRGNFTDLKWAQAQTGNANSGGDWFYVGEHLIDKNDLDCVWRMKEVWRNGKKQEFYQLWSPVSTLILLIKLHLPLRTYQVRMLDSGEADYMRYENGNWIENNKHTFALKNVKKGIFRQFKDNALGFESTGLYINTNKTADQNKDEFERGYEIPWQNEDVLYWLEKLRNWQEKYNQIIGPTDCITLNERHTSGKKSKAYLSAMGHICFLMRDASATL